VVKVDDGLQTPALDRLCAFLYANGRQDWVVELPGILKAEGLFDQTQIFHYRPRRVMARVNGELHLATIEEFARRLGEDGKGSEGEELLGLVRQGAEEVELGAAMSTPRAVTIGRKLRAWAEVFFPGGIVLADCRATYIERYWLGDRV
jgi:hypothetical protein